MEGVPLDGNGGLGGICSISYHMKDRTFSETFFPSGTLFEDAFLSHLNIWKYPTDKNIL